DVHAASPERTACRRRMIERGVTTVASAVLIAAVSAAAPAQNQASAAHAWSLSAANRGAIDAIFKAHDTPHSPGCALGVMRDGRLAYARGYGMADLERRVPITPAT